MSLIWVWFTVIFVQERGFEPVSVTSEDGETQVYYKGSYALVIGVSEYVAWDDLNMVPRETDEVSKALRKHGFRVKRLRNPDSQELEKGLNDFMDNFGFDEDNRLLVFFAGHGHTIRDKGFIVPSDAPKPRWDKNRKNDEAEFRRKATSMTKILSLCKDVTARHTLFLFDSCFSGTIFEVRSHVIVPPDIDHLMREPVRQFITAGGKLDTVPAKSYFAPSFVKGLSGEGDLDGDGYITGTEMGLYLRKRVGSYKIGQTPKFGKILDPSLDNGDFVFVVRDQLRNFSKPIKPRHDTTRHYASIQVAAEAPGKLFLNNNLIGALKLKTELHLENLQVGPHVFRFEAKGYEPLEKYIVLKLNQKLKLTFNPIRSAGARMTKTIGGVEFAFRWCPPGTFLMGSPASEAGRFNRETQHHVTLSKGFWMMETEVIQAQFQALMGFNPSTFRGANRPVEMISWNDAQVFIEKINLLFTETGLVFSLPTEAQWEYACRAGTPGPYAGELDLMAWYQRNVKAGTYQVRGKTPNPWGLFDMHGNVWEWCSDWYDSYPIDPLIDPVGPANGYRKVLRGGSWFDKSKSWLRSAHRFWRDPSVKVRNFGFRLVLQ